MPLESATYVADLVNTNPLQTEGLNTADDHLRLIKAVLLSTFPNMDAAMTAEVEKLNNGNVPTGTIVLWYGSIATCPTGWGVCDGTLYNKMDGSGTIQSPDLRDKFVIGSGTGATNAVNATGGSGTTSSNGAHTHTFTSASDGSHTHGGVTGSHVLTTAEMPLHGHAFRRSTANSGAPDGSGGFAMFTTSVTTAVEYTGSPSSTSGQQIGGTGGGGGHTHTISSTGSTHSHTGTTDSDGAHTHTLTPPFLALCYIIRK